MSFSNPLRIYSSSDGTTLTVTVEPWASEYQVVIGEACVVVARHPTVLPTFGVRPTNDGIIVWINEGGSTYEFWRGDTLEEQMSVPIPG